MKKKNKIKSVFLILLFILFWGFVMYSLQSLLMPKYNDRIESAMIEEYYKDKSKHEVIMIGDCEVYESFSPIRLYERYGITSYLRGSPQQLAWQSYYLLEDTLYYENPKVVVFNVLALKYNEPKSEAFNHIALDGMRLSLSKIKSARASLTEGENLLEYIFPIFRYHSRWSELTDEDFEYIYKKNINTHNGYYLRLESREQQIFSDPTPLTDYKLGDNAMLYLRKMVELCKKNDIELVLIKAPIEYPYWYREWDEQVVDFAEENNLEYINFLNLKKEVGLNMSSDTYDGGLHLNVYGAEKMSDFFGRWLIENYNLTDYRENDKYQKIWQEKIEKYEKDKENQLKKIRNSREGF